MAPSEQRQGRELEVEGSALDPRKVTLVGAGLVAVFGGLALWSLLGNEAEVVSVPELGGGPETSPNTSGTDESSGAGRRPPPVQKPIEQGRLLAKPREVSGLLAQEFQRNRADGGATFTALRNVLPARGVTVVNVWATYCEPCKREFPGFRDLQKGWGNNVRFVPIQHGKGEALELKAIMPEAPDLLVDYMPGGAVQAELGKVGALPKDAPIPITMLLDCRQELRWVQQGEITDMQAFDRAVQTLKEELRSPRCAAKAQAVAPLTPPVPVSACKNKCKENQTCTLRPSDGTYQCLDDLG